MNNPIIYFGNEQLAQGLERVITPTLDALIREKYNVIAVITHPDTPRGRGRILAPPKVKVVAEAHNIPVFQPSNTSELTGCTREIVKNSKFPPIGVLASFGYIVTETVLQLFEPIGIINIHPSLLPKYRGSTPIESAILNSDKVAGVSLMKLAKKMDAGSIYAQKTVPLAGSESKQQLYEVLAQDGATMMVENLPKIADGLLKPTIQDETDATYTKKLDKSMSELKPEEKTAKELYDQIRAFAGFPKSKYTFSDMNCVVIKAHVSEEKQTALDLKCTDGKYLVIDRLVPEGRKEMSAKDFLNGVKS